MDPEEKQKILDSGVKEYTNQLNNMGPRAFKKGTKESLIAGFMDGLRYGLEITDLLAKEANVKLYHP